MSMLDMANPLENLWVMMEMVTPPLLDGRMMVTLSMDLMD